MGSNFTSMRRRNYGPGMRRGGLMVSSIAASALLLGAGTAGAVPSIGSIDLGSANSGSLGSTGSVMPEWGREEPVTLPALRDDITESKIVSRTDSADRAVRLMVDSPALRRTVGVDIILPADASVARPALYMLEGVDARENQSGWVDPGTTAFFADKNVNVVMINGGVGSLYTDWNEIDPGVGLHKWETFITKELPPLINTELNTNGVQSILGNSMGAQGAMMLAHRNPGMYKGIAVMSGCYSTMDPLGNTSAQWTVSSRNGDPTNMWGPVGSPQWEAHDSVINAESLRGMDIYLSTNSGTPGRHEDFSDPKILDRIFIGGGLEIAANFCTQIMDERLQDLRIPATVDYEPTGTHSWGYWTDQLPKAWIVLSKSLGL